jgi:mono/diheme cytochrome c family protein
MRTISVVLTDDPGVDALTRAHKAVFDGRVTTTAPPTRSYRWVAAPLAAFAGISLLAGLLAKHEPRSKGYFQLFFSDPVHLKAGFATLAVVLACFQLFTAAWIFRKLPWPKPAWVNPVHRWSGRLAFACTLPVAYHCIFKLGFQSPDARVLAHSLFGSFVYGAFAAKVTVLRLHRFPRPVLPVAGGLLFAVLVGAWFTSAYWLYDRSTPRPASGAALVIPANARAAAGAAVFRTAGCGACHTFAKARSHGQVGPNLDSLKPGYARVLVQVTNGGGAMPAFRGRLSEQQIRDVAAYVASP